MTTPATPVEDALNTELARANLARLRGDYDLAERQCMALLKTAPHDPTVAALLGDVSAEQGKLDEAVQWYEMAVDAGAPSGIEEKLDGVRVRVKERDATMSEREIGLPQRTWTSPPVLLGGTVILLMLLVCAYVAGTYRTPVKAAPVSQDQPALVLPTTGQGAVGSAVSAAPQDSHASDSAKAALNSTSPDAAAASTPTPKSSIDADLQPLLAGAAVPLSRITSAALDPRNHSVTVDVPLQAGEDPRALAAEVAQAGLPVVKEATTLTVRIVSNGRPVFVADCTRERYDAYVKRDNQADGATSLADALLTNEWKDGSDAAATGR